MSEVKNMLDFSEWYGDFEDFVEEVLSSLRDDVDKDLTHMKIHPDLYYAITAHLHENVTPSKDIIDGKLQKFIGLKVVIEHFD